MLNIEVEHASKVELLLMITVLIELEPRIMMDLRFHEKKPHYIRGKFEQ